MSDLSSKELAKRLRALDFGVRMPPSVIEETAEFLERLTDEPEAVQSRPCGLCGGLGCRMCGMTGKYIPDAPTGPFACENCNRLAREAHTWSTALAETIKRHGAASPPTETRESGWLVENGKNDTQYRYFDEIGLVSWTSDAQKAIRFARRVDAEQFAAADEDAWAIVEHVFVTSETKESALRVPPYKPRREDFLTCGVFDDAAYEAAMQRYRTATETSGDQS